NSQARRNLPGLPMRCSSASYRPIHFVGARQTAVGRELVDDIGELLAEPSQELITRQARPLCQEIDLLGREHLRQFMRCAWLVLSGADPRLRRIAPARALELLQQIAQTTAQHPSQSAGSQAGQ